MIAEWIKGPQLVHWLEEQGCDLSAPSVGDAADRALRRWRKGEAASIFTADTLLIRLGLHLDLLPDDLWEYRSPKGNRGARYTAEEKAEAVSRARRGEPIKRIARDIGCHPKSVKCWINKSNIEPEAA